MVPEEQRRGDAERNHRLVIEAGIELLASDPEAGVHEVADAAGVGRTTVYRHFPNRESLLEAVIAEILDRSRRELEAAVAEVDTEAAIRGLGATSIDLALRFGRLFAARDGHSAAYEAFKSDDSSPARHFLRAARERNQIRTDMPVGWMRSVIQAVTFTAVDEIRAGAVTEDAAIRLAGDTLVSILIPD